MLKFQPFPTLITQSLNLINLSSQQIDDLYKMRSDIRMHEFTDTKIDSSRTDTQMYIDKMLKGVADNKWIVWAIEHKETKTIIGTISIWNFENNGAELGYGIIPSFQAQGLMKEALLEVVDYGLNTLGLSELYAYTEISNTRSIMLLKKCKFEYINDVIDKGFIQNKDFHMACYRIK